MGLKVKVKALLPLLRNFELAVPNFHYSDLVSSPNFLIMLVFFCGVIELFKQCLTFKFYLKFEFGVKYNYKSKIGVKNHITIKEFTNLLPIQFHLLISNNHLFLVCAKKQESFKKSS